MSLTNVGGKISADKTRVGIVLDKALVAELTARGDALSQSTSMFVRWIIEDWKARGSPPVNELDRVMQASKLSLPKQTRKSA